MVNIEKKHLEVCDKLADEINSAIRRFRQPSYKTNLDKYKRVLAKKDISVEEKKKIIANNIHDLAVKTFSIDLKKVTSQKNVLDALRANIQALRKLVLMLGNINHYLQNTFLQELKLAKKAVNWGNLKEKDIKRLIEEESKHLGKREFERLEYTVFKLIKKIIFLDQRLLKRYRKKEKEVITSSKTEIKDIDAILKRESELLRHLDAKLPPQSEIKARLLKNSIFSEWVSRIIALIASFENEYKKEAIIFQKLKKNQKTRKKINAKIKHLIDEKWDLLKLKESRLLSMENIKSIEAEHQKISHDYASVLRL